MIAALLRPSAASICRIYRSQQSSLCDPQKSYAHSAASFYSKFGLQYASPHVMGPFFDEFPAWSFFSMMIYPKSGGLIGAATEWGGGAGGVTEDRTGKRQKQEQKWSRELFRITSPEESSGGTHPEVWFFPSRWYQHWRHQLDVGFLVLRDFHRQSVMPVEVRIREFPWELTNLNVGCSPSIPLEKFRFGEISSLATMIAHKRTKTKMIDQSFWQPNNRNRVMIWWSGLCIFKGGLPDT